MENHVLKKMRNTGHKSSMSLVSSSVVMLIYCIMFNLNLDVDGWFSGNFELRSDFHCKTACPMILCVHDTACPMILCVHDTACPMILCVHDTACPMILYGLLKCVKDELG
jgi:hypothetical protein